MKKNLLCFALLLAMAVTMTAMVFAPNVSALAEGAGTFMVELDCYERVSYGERLSYVFHIWGADGESLDFYGRQYWDDWEDWIEADRKYWEAPVTVTLFDESGEAVWVNDSGVLEDFSYQDWNDLALNTAEMKAWKSGEYTLRVEVTVESETQYAEKTFYFTGYEDVLGDINSNGQIEATDYLLLKRFVLGTFKLADWQKAVADINGDGNINALDYMLLKRHVLGTYKIA